MRFTYIGGPTALIEWHGVRLLTDPTFDAAGGDYTTGPVTLTKIMGPAIEASAIGPIDAVLLSHDHHADNLDATGRALLPNAAAVLTTKAGAERLALPNVKGLAHWQSVDVGPVRVTATPARHGPADGDRGPVIGFVLTDRDGASNEAIYVSGDTVWYDGLQEIAGRFHVTLAILFMGAARVAVVGPSNLTLTAEEAVEAARLFAKAKIIPVHYEGWRHFSESRVQIEAAFQAAGLQDRLCWPEAGVAVEFDS